MLVNCELYSLERKDRYLWVESLGRCLFEANKQVYESIVLNILGRRDVHGRVSCRFEETLYLMTVLRVAKLIFPRAVIMEGMVVIELTHVEVALFAAPKSSSGACSKVRKVLAMSSS